MERPSVDRLTYENLVSTTSIESLAHGYILNCRCEGKSPRTLAIYGIVRSYSVWYCRRHNVPDELYKLNAAQVRSFLWYVAREAGRTQSMLRAR